MQSPTPGQELGRHRHQKDVLVGVARLLAGQAEGLQRLGRALLVPCPPGLVVAQVVEAVLEAQR
eukprot:2940788-Lingulodinium_polyedra.AAC.1